jgi:CheY-like chemotaxis protein
MAVPPHQPRMPLSGQRVLVVEDDKDIRETVVDVLLDEGYRVYEAPDGKPALARLHASREQFVVLLDLNMPGMDGKAVLQAVAAHDELAVRHAYILVTANQRTLPLAFVNLLTQLRVAVIAKPFDIDALLDAVAQAAARLHGG